VTAPTIISALDAPELFGSLFRGASWARWRVFLKALFGLPLTAGELEIFRHHTGRQMPPTGPFREAALVIGRRGGKSRILGLIAAYLSVFIDYSPHLAAGEVPVVAIIAADRRQARVLLRYVLGALKASPILADMVAGETAETITLSNNVVVEIHTGTIAAPRGRTFAAVLCDEIAFWRSEEGAANPDVEIIAAVRPGLATIPTSRLIMASSPYARRGALWQAFRQHYGRDDARVLVWRGTSLEMNPGLDPAIVAEARASDPASARAEYDAEFRDDVSAFVPREVIEAAVVPGRFELPRIGGVRYVGFVDPSGGSSDAMTMAIVHRDGGAIVLDAVRERRPPFSPEAAVEEFAATLKGYGIYRITGDRYAGEWPREQFRKHGIDYIASDRNKSQIYIEMLPMLNSGKIELLDNPRLIAQLCGLERRTARGGRDSIDHAPGGHDDLANAVAGAAVLAAAGAGPLRVSDDLLAWSRVPAVPFSAFSEPAAAVIGAVRR